MRNGAQSTDGVLAHPCGDGESLIAAGREDLERLLGHIVSDEVHGMAILSVTLASGMLCPDMQFANASGLSQ
jgi:hypothetical protein